MRLLTFLIILLLSHTGAFGQVVPSGQTYQGTNYRGGVGADRATWMAVVIDTTTANSNSDFSAFRMKGRFFIDNNGVYWFHNGTKWEQVATVTVLSTYVKYSDTSAMLFPYLRKSDAAATYVKYTDTAIMLMPYLKTFDTTSMLSVYLRKIDTASLSTRINLRVSYTDTANMLAPYLRSSVAATTYWSLSGNAISAVQTLGSTTAFPIRFRTNNTTWDSLSSVGNRVFITPATNNFDFFKAIDVPGNQIFKWTNNTADIRLRIGTDAMPWDFLYVKGSGSSAITSGSNLRLNATSIVAINPQSTLILSIVANQFLRMNTGGEGGTTRFQLNSLGRFTFGGTTDDGVNLAQFLGSIMVQTTPLGANTDSLLVKGTGGQLRVIAPLPEIQLQTTVQTTNATPTTIATIPLTTSGATLVLSSVDVTGNPSGAGSVWNLKRCAIKNNAGTLTKVGGATVVPTPTQRTAPISTADFDIVISGTNVLIQVTGEAATTINWKATYKYHID